MLRSHFRTISVLATVALGLGLVGTACGGGGLVPGPPGTGGVPTDGDGGGSPTGGESQGGMGGEGGMGGAAGGQGGMGGDGTGGSTQPCDPVEEDCEGEGILHVSPDGDDEAEGTVAAPLETIGEALTRVAVAFAAGEEVPLVYACATSGTYQETLSLTAAHGAVGIYGGFDCDLFEPSSAQAALVADDAEGHRIEGAAGVTLGDLQLESPDAVGPGESSVALTVVDSTGVRILRSDLVAGEGSDGANGMGYTEAAEAGEAGNPGVDACVVSGGPVNEGGEAATTTCGGVASLSVGGSGGPGGVSSFPGGPGALGEPDGGAVGAGEDGSVCMAGGNGEVGSAGDHGAISAPLGTLESTTYVPPAGGDGAPGEVGEGGGGGGGAAKPTGCDTGASGGSGGGGGCPGAGAAGGHGGGGSFGLVSISSEIELLELSIVVAVGGEGGAGGDGQEGGARGDGGDPGVGASDGNDACNGGNGGRGGNGGSGAGGAGGPSIGVAYVDGTPTGLGDIAVTLPSAGAIGGPGGFLHTETGQGPTGAVVDTWSP